VQEKQELETILIKKQQPDEIDQIKRDYLTTVQSIQKEAARFFKLRQKDKALEYLEKLFDLAAYAYDREVLKEVSFAQGLITAYFKDYQGAI